MAEKLVDFVAKLRQRGKKDQPPKLLWDIKMFLKRRFFLFFVYFLLYQRRYTKRRKKGGWPNYYDSFFIKSKA